MGLVEKFRDRIEKAASIAELEAVGQDFGQVKGLTVDEREKISRSLNGRFLALAEGKQDSHVRGAGPEDSLDATIDEAAPQVLEDLHQEGQEKEELEAAAASSLAIPRGMELTETQVEATVRHFALFEEVKRKVLDPRVDVLYIGPDGRPRTYTQRREAASRYIRKSGWRKLAMVFGINLRVVGMDRENHRDGHGTYYLWNARVRAEHPASGKYVEGIGVANSRDQFFTRGGKRPADEKDIKLKAQTVGMNRAISDLIGGGQMSAEEMEEGPAPS